MLINIKVLKQIDSVHHIIGTLQGLASQFGISHEPDQSRTKKKKTNNGGH